MIRADFKLIYRLSLLLLTISTGLVYASECDPKDLAKFSLVKDTRWGSAKPLLLEDMVDYAKLHGLNPESLTTIAYHYGQSQRGDVNTIRSVKKYKAELLEEMDRLGEQMENLDYGTVAFDNIAKEMTRVGGRHQLQMEALEMMDWASALKFAPNKTDVIESFAPIERVIIENTD
jgi:hypothetical protein